MQIGSMLQTAQGIVLFIIVIGILVVVHELGHYLAARRFGVEAPEFGIGFPPRLFTFWKTNGLLEIQGRRIIIPKKFVLPEQVRNGAWVTYKTETREGKEYLTAITPVDDMAISCSQHCICPPGTARKCTQRRQVPGSTAYVPAVAGLIIAGEVINDLAGKQPEMVQN